MSCCRPGFNSYSISKGFLGQPIQPMLKLIKYCLLLCFIFSLAASLCLVIGHHLPSQLSILRFPDCDLPCWIGITPGKTTIAEAKELVTHIYGNISEYSLAFREDVWEITDNMSRDRIKIVISPFVDQPDFVIDDLVIVYASSSGSGIPYGDLYAVLGPPTEILLSSPDNAPYPIFRYKTQRIHVALDLVVMKGQCGQFAPSTPVSYFSIHSSPPLNYAWVSDPLPWRGFRHCYQFLR